PADDAQRRRARRAQNLEPQDRRAHDDGPSRRYRLQRGPRLRPRLLRRPGCRRARLAGGHRRIPPGGRLSLDLLGRAARRARRRASHAARTGGRCRRSAESPRARLSGDRRLNGGDTRRSVAVELAAIGAAALVFVATFRVRPPWLDFALAGAAVALIV